MPAKTAPKTASKRRATAKKPAAPKKAAPAKSAATAKSPAKAKPAPAKKAAPAAPKSGPVIRSKLRKSEVVDLISNETGVSKDQVRLVLDKREDLIERALKPRGIGVFQDGSLVKFERYKRKATKQRMGRNLKTNEPIVIPAKRAHNAVKVKKLTKLKNLV